MKLPINQIICGDALTELRKLPDESISCCISSPPYWGLRAYGTNPQIWDGDEKCWHEWGKSIVQKKSGGTGKTNVGNFKDDRIHYEAKTQFCSLCGAWRGELGLEPTFELYIEHLCTIYDEVKRVLRKDGCVFVNLADSYNGSGGDHKGHHKNDASFQSGLMRGSRPTRASIPAKSLCLIPDRFRIAMVERGWIIRNKINWVKPNPMPSSAKDRFTVDFEDVIFMVKSNDILFWVRPDGKLVSKEPDYKNGQEWLDWQWGLRKGKRVQLSLWQGHTYFFEPQYEMMAPGSEAKLISGCTDKNKMTDGPYAVNTASYNKFGQKVARGEVLGRNKRTTWTISTQAYAEAHFATFPEKLVEPMIKAGCPRYICKKCGQPRKKIYDKGELVIPSGRKNTQPQEQRAIKEKGWSNEQGFAAQCYYPKSFKGYTDCGCGAGFRPGITLDPFIGSGTTGQVATYLGRDWIGIELSEEYIPMATRRIAQGETGIPVKEQKAGQGALFP